MPHIRSGKLRALGKRAPQPGAAEGPDLGGGRVPGYEANNWWGVLVPAGTPAAISARLRQEIAAILESPEMRKREAEGGEAASVSVQQFSDHIAAETAKWSRMVKEAAIKAE